MSAIRKTWRIAVLLLTLTLSVPAAHATVERVEILERTALANGAAFGAAGSYEKLRGRAWIALDPANRANARIVDLNNAPRDSRGRVVFSTDFLMLRPVDPARRNGTLLYEVNNRGFIAMLGQMQQQDPAHNDPTTAADMGNGFLLRQGFTLLWSAWTWDTGTPSADNRLFHLDPPVATDHGRQATGRVAYEMLVDRPAATARFTGLFSRAYPHAADTDESATLTMRDSAQGARLTIPRGDWRFLPSKDGNAPDTIALDGGFTPGRLYELVYTARDPVIVGAGLAGIRDLLSWFKTDAFEGAPPLNHAILFGISQSGRVIATMLNLGLTVDEAGRPAFDGAYAQVAGAGKGSFDHRFAMPTRHFSPLVEQGYPTDYFPFTSTATTDPLSGRTASLLDAARAAGNVPKVFFANTSAEYWNRSASLITTTPDGGRDAAIDASVRVYFLAGSQHYVGKTKERLPLVNCVDRADHYPVERALILALDAWVRGSGEPPASSYPTIAGGELIPFDRYAGAFPIAGMRLPDSQLRPPRLDLGPRFASEGIADRVPPVAGPPYVTLVPAADRDGNDRGGVRQIELEAPLGTYLGWNTRAAETGFPGVQARYDGSFIPFARTRAELQSGDSRLPIAERYPTKAAFLAKVRAAADRLVTHGFLLPEEVDARIAAQSALYDRVLAHDPADPSCSYLF